MSRNKNKHCALNPGQPVPLKHQLIELFWTLGPAFTRWAESHMTQPGLTPQRIRLLALLNKNGAMMMSGLSDEMGVTATTITALVDALEKDDMVVRKPHKTDRRATLIALTAKAEKRLTENCAKLREQVSELFSSFTGTEQEQFLRHLLHMRAALVERDILEDHCPKVAEAGRKS
jgi:DNA-binding MarR family transcriptional regulator